MFVCTLSCRYQDQTVQAQGRAPNKRASYRDAARALLARLALVPAGPVAHAEDAAPEPTMPAIKPHPRTAPAAGTPAQTLLAVRLLESVLRAGAAVSADLSGSAARMVVYHPDGSPLPDADPPVPLRAENVELVLPGMGVGVRATPVPV
ncbi:hypothetical protein [Streptosporangium roseum]|uniref:hypothetical protein n=1 Tax=Streptosporangium roseum TaxID=2001 RepID=UPI003317E552